MTLVLGVTGGIAAGKSSVAAMFGELGAVVVSADQLAREVVAPGAAALAQLTEAFGRRIVDARGALACEPGFRSERILGGVFCPVNGQVNPLLLCRAFARGARRRGSTIMLGTVVQDISHANGRVRAVRTSEGDIPCRLVVNAAGAWAADIADMVGRRVPVAPARGQIVLTEPLPRFLHRVLSGAEPSATKVTSQRR